MAEPEPDLAEFVAESASRRAGQRMRVDVILDELDDTRRAQLTAALADLSITHPAISAVVTRWGWPLSDSAIRTWRHAHNLR